jgi:hypothetical protein
MITRRIDQIADIAIAEMEERLWQDKMGKYIDGRGRINYGLLLEDLLEDIASAIDMGELDETVAQILDEMRRAG